VGGAAGAGFFAAFGDAGGAAGFTGLGGCDCVGGGVEALMFVGRWRSVVEELVFCALTAADIDRAKAQTAIVFIISFILVVGTLQSPNSGNNLRPSGCISIAKPQD
jgi:hypothetical protein